MTKDVVVPTYPYVVLSRMKGHENYISNLSEYFAKTPAV